MPLATSRAESLLRQALDGIPLRHEEGVFLLTSPDVALKELAAAARELRKRGKGTTITYSPKVFLPLTNLCRDRCGYCTFRRDPDQPGAHWMEPEEVLAVARTGEQLGCKEALLSLGDRPETVFPEAKEWLRRRGLSRTLDYVAWIGDFLVENTSLLVHSNPGLMARADLQRLRESNVSLGLMLESTSTALLAKGAAHDDAIDKAPERRRRVLREAGELRIPFTTGILIGIGETPQDVIDSLLAIREISIRYGHIQEVIVQNFVPKPEIPMRDWPAPPREYFARVVAVARILLGAGMNLQAPPNLSPAALETLLDCGINDWGGISPLTLDFINPECPWPQVEALNRLALSHGLQLRERLAVYPEFATRQDFFSPRVWDVLGRRMDGQGYPLAANPVSAARQ